MGNDGWTQVYLGGLDQTIHPTDEELEHAWSQRWNLQEEPFAWNGPGTSLVKRSDDGTCRGFAFLSFYSLEGATRAVNAINSENHEGTSSELKAELCKPKKKKPNKSEASGQDYSNLRLRRQRTSKPVAKHPVIVSSTGKKTGLGNKTR